jgi:probable rRNA maturation factor
MIILDPDLDPDPRPSTKSGPPSPESRKAERATRLPSVRTLTTFLREAQTAVRLKGHVSVLLTTDPAIRKLNRDFRHKNKATDVLSFPTEPIPGVRRSEQPAGDLAISVDTARKQASGQGHPLTTEIEVLILHGLLHLAGYDHETDTGQMARRERTLRAQLKLPLGLIERTTEGSPRPRALKGHGFSRAERPSKRRGALAPEGRISGSKAVPRLKNQNKPRRARSAVSRTAGAAAARTAGAA